MNYPVWELTTFGGGFFIALIAVVHVYVAHFAVGGGLFLVLTEMKGHRENSKPILDYVHRHSKFFLLLTMVFGTVTGVGIWFTIALLSPSATSSLIHTFVFGWATEWVCFAAEIIALFIYFYTFGKMEKKAHVKIGWLYFIFAWLSLFFINGIIGFMLTPGKWLETGNFWHGFFNPTFLPSLIFRTTLALMFAGVFGFVTSTFIKDESFRKTMVQYCAKWLLIPFLFLVLSAFWYLNVIPEGSETMIIKRSHEIKSIIQIFIVLSSVIFIMGLLMAIRLPATAKKPVAFVLLFIGLIYMGSFEWIRESVRRPYLIYNYLYSNSILKSDLEKIREQGILKTAKWVNIKEVNSNNVLAAGKEIFKIACSSCHSIHGPMNDILSLTEKFSVYGMQTTLDGMGKLNPYMPIFPGTDVEKTALSRYIVQDLHKNQEELQSADIETELLFDIPGYDTAKDQYILLSWNSKGVHFFSDSDAFFSLLPPGNTLYACLIKTGEIPERIFDDVEITYSIEKGFEHPSKWVIFWEKSKSLIGKILDKDAGISGNQTQGTMKLDDTGEIFFADHIPVVPYSKDGSFNPYPLMTIVAKDKTSGKILATTKTVAPASTEMGCKNCHGGKWKFAGVAGVSDTTANDILSMHDKNSHTNLKKLAKKGKPVSCKSCHKDFAEKGESDILNLSAAMHGWHANYLPNQGADACYNCHTDSPEGSTRSFRGFHADIFECTSCHGAIEDHALSLLKAEVKNNKKGALRLMEHLKPQMAESVDKIRPRAPWINEPDCLSCHVDFQLPEDIDEFTAFNQWTDSSEELFRHRRDDMEALNCSACHGSPHAIYPATNIFVNNRDNIQPMQYQKNTNTLGSSNCKLCHTVPMEDEAHHANSKK
jgi:hypothetical protein